MHGDDDGDYFDDDINDHRKKGMRKATMMMMIMMSVQIACALFARLVSNSLGLSTCGRFLTMLLMLYLIVNMDRNLCSMKRIPCYTTRSCGAMDNASAYGAEDSRFESWQDRYIFLIILFLIISYFHSIQ